MVAALFNAGDHVPTIPFVEVVGNADNNVPAHIGDTGAKVGLVLAELTVTTIVALAAHCPGFGVKV